ncbi:hypothetical protein ACFWB0_04195 [Rhodococcus sp. NPDC060086]|uniref:hypothetical protein n=1 Tax=Rhodococcus sp. NPDC060086 TaxID=3347055 RepID=UPI003656AF3D
MSTGDSAALQGLAGTMRGLRDTFRSLTQSGEGAEYTTDTPMSPGTYRAVFVGPALLRIAAPRAIAVAGMPHWYGKRVHADGTAANLLGRDNGTPREHLPIAVALEQSWLDGRPAVTVSYGADAPIPWRWVRDEFRALDERTWLGLTFVGGSWSRRAASPFVLVRDDDRP